MALVYLNGRLVEEAAAVLSVFDHGFTTGDGVFEGVLVEGGRPFALRRHLDRLDRSASIVGLPPLDRDELTAATAAVIAAANYERGKLRITVTAGAGPLGSGRGTAPPSVIVAIEPLGSPPPPTAGARVAIAPWPRTGHGAAAGAKTISYVDNVVALAWANKVGASEALLLNEAGDVCEGTGSNIFLVVGDRLVTPPTSSGCLAGVTRALVLEVTGAEEADVAANELSQVEEAFLTSTSRGVMPIAHLGEFDLGACPGRCTASAAEAYASLMNRTFDP